MKEKTLADRGRQARKEDWENTDGENIVERAWRGTLKGHKKDKEVKT